MANKIDSNVTGLRYAQEDSPKTLPGSGVIWYPLEPNGYNDFGGQITTVARNPINPSRQRKKGVTTDLDASGGFGQDLTQDGLTRLLQGFFFASIREKTTTQPLNGTAIVVSDVDNATDTFTIGSGGAGFIANSLIFNSGFTNSGNNGLKSVASSTATTVVTNEAPVDEAAPPAAAKIERVGYQFASATLDVDVSGDYPKLTRASGTVDFTTFGLLPGEWIFIGGDSATLRFTTTTNNGFARVKSVAATYIELDKTAATMANETGTGKTIRIFFGNILRNEPAAADIVRRTYQLERTLGADNDGTMSEYLTGSVPNELSIQVRQSDKVTVDLSFVSMDHEQYTGAEGVKAGSRPDLDESPAFNTSSDFSRIKLHQITANSANPSPLFAFLTELTLTVNNNVSPDKAVGVLGAFDATAGTFQVSGSVTAYFANVTAVQAVRNNADVSLDLAMVKNNAGIVIDVPLLTLGDGRLNVEQDRPVTLPLSMDAAEGAYNSTLLYNVFPYLPTLADV